MLTALIWIVMTPILIILMGYALLFGLFILMQVVRCLAGWDDKS